MAIYQECNSIGGWQTIAVDSSKADKDPYQVMIPPWAKDSDMSAEAICSCPGYEYRGRCRHLSVAYGKICEWSELKEDIQTPEERKKHICPKCGNKTSVILENE